jgi:hypothetical protein
MHALTSGGVVGHAERGDAVGALGVEDVEVLRVGDVAVGAAAAAGEALQDLPRHGARVAPRRAVLRQHHRAARHHGVLDLAPHCCCCGLTRERSDPIPPSPPSRRASRARRKRGKKETDHPARPCLPAYTTTTATMRADHSVHACLLPLVFWGGRLTRNLAGLVGARSSQSATRRASPSPSHRRGGG